MLSKQGNGEVPAQSLSWHMSYIFLREQVNAFESRGAQQIKVLVSMDYSINQRPFFTRFDEEALMFPSEVRWAELWLARHSCLYYTRASRQNRPF